MRYSVFFTLAIFIFLIGCGGGEGEKTSLYTKNYEANTTLNLLNPNRGFYKPVASLETTTSSDRFQRAKEQGFSLVYAALKLDDYKEIEQLPESLLATLQKNLQEANNAHVKIILRIKYRDKNAQDPSKDMIIGHLKQLEPIFKNYQDSIAVVEAGCIGAYGEWHSFSGDFVATNPYYKENRKAIITALTELFPDKFILMRTPMHKELLFGDSIEYGDVASQAQITPNIAFTQDIRAKVSHHNDCFLASETDKGTYRSDNITFWKNYVANDAHYAPLGGETCIDESTYTNCDYAQKALQSQEWSFVNVAYNPDVIQRWKDEGCYQKIAENLGYHFVVDGLNYSQEKTTLHLELFITNKGYTTPFDPYEVSFLLHSNEHNYSFSFPKIDVRRWYAQEQYQIKADINLSQVLDGNYTLSLQILHNNFSIRFANKNMWYDMLQSNQLLDNIHIK